MGTTLQEKHEVVPFEPDAEQVEELRQAEEELRIEKELVEKHGRRITELEVELAKAKDDRSLLRRKIDKQAREVWRFRAGDTLTTICEICNNELEIDGDYEVGHGLSAAYHGLERARAEDGLDPKRNPMWMLFCVHRKCNKDQGTALLVPPGTVRACRCLVGVLGAGCSGLYQFKAEQGFQNSPEQAKRMTELCQRMVTWERSHLEAERRSQEEE